MNLYGFLKNQPVDRLDFLGMNVLEDVPVLDFNSIAFSLGECGGFTWTIDWNVSSPPGPKGGVVLQEMKVDAVDVDGKILAKEHYHEAWYVKKDSQTIGTVDEGTFFADPDSDLSIEEQMNAPLSDRIRENPSDTWRVPDTTYDGTEGVHTHHGWARYRTEITPEKVKSELYEKLNYAGNLPARDMKNGKPNFGDSSKSEIVERIIKVSWCCTENATPEQRKTKIEVVKPEFLRINQGPKK